MLLCQSPLSCSSNPLPRIVGICQQAHIAAFPSSLIAAWGASHRVKFFTTQCPSELCVQKRRGAAVVSTPTAVFCVLCSGIFIIYIFKMFCCQIVAILTFCLLKLLSGCCLATFPDFPSVHMIVWHRSTSGQSGRHDHMIICQHPVSSRTNQLMNVRLWSKVTLSVTLHWSVMTHSLELVVGSGHI